MLFGGNISARIEGDEMTSSNVSRNGWGLAPKFENIPAALLTLRWACWVAEPKPDGKISKAPRHPNGGWPVATNKPETWATFDECRAAYQSGCFDGIGVLLEARQGIVGIDVDDAINTLVRHPEVFAQITQVVNAGGYVERSPSGKGLRIFVQGTLTENAGKKREGLEIYNDRRFLTVTGHARGYHHGKTD